MIGLAALLLAATSPVAAASEPSVVHAAPREKPRYRAQASPACKDWREARAGTRPDSDPFFVAVSRLWVMGYVTGFNIHGPDRSGNLLGPTTDAEIYAFLDAWCADHPSGFFVDAMRPLAGAILRRRGETQPDAEGDPSRRRATIMVAKTCREWIEARDDKMLRLGYGTAVRGYLTAYNLYGPEPEGDIVGPGDDAFIDTWIDGWCATRTTLLFAAFAPLIDHLAAERAAGRLPAGGMGPRDIRSAGASQDR